MVMYKYPNVMAMAVQLHMEVVKPIEDHYANRMTSTKEYKPRTCCVASVKILEESCRAVAGSNAPKRHKALQTFLSSLALQ